MDNKIIQEVLETEEFRLLLRDYLARKISGEYHFTDFEGELIKKEVRLLIIEEAKQAIAELVEEYHELDNVKDLIRKELGSFTRKEIIDLINQ